MISYCEVQSAQPPGALRAALARALKVSTDELLGVKPVRETLAPKTARLLKLIDAMLDTRRRSTPPAHAKRKAS